MVQTKAKNKNNEKNQRMVYMKITSYTVNGLCNRLRCMSSCFTLAEIYNKEFDIKWDNHERDCNCEITDLFQIDNQFISKDEYSKKNFCKFRSKPKRNTFSFFDDKLFIQRMSRKPRSTHEIFKRLETNNNIVIITDDVIVHPSLSKTDFFEKQKQFYNNLKLNKNVRNKIDDFMSNFFNKKTLGVQVRGTDSLKAYSYKTSRRYYDKNIKNMTKQNMFDRVVKSISKKIDDYEQIYVCSDEMEIIQMFQNKFKNVITYPKTEVIRTSTEGMQDALIDWWLLGECDYIFYTHQSSFGIEATIRRGYEFSTEIKY